MSEQGPVDGPATRTCSLLWMLLSVAGVTTHMSPRKSIQRKKGVLASRGKKAARQWRTGGEDNKSGNKRSCFVQGLAAIEIWVKTCENL